MADVQFSGNSNGTGNLSIANFFENNRQVNLRLYAGSFFIIIPILVF
jgi:uncharacterized membrane protein SpoIIM required for sporulation